MRETLKKMKNNNGFTLMEMIIVVAIIAILVALIAPNLTGFLDSASKTSKQANAKSCYTAANAWAVQQRIDGHPVPNSTITIAVTGFVENAPANGGDALLTAVDYKTFGNAVLKITMENGTVKTVEWDSKDGTSEAKVTYPSTAAAPAAGGNS